MATINFHEFIKEFKAGHLDAQLTEKLIALVDAVQRNTAMGKLIVEITLKPKGEGEINTTAKFKMQAPERDTMEAIMFATPENNLIASDPKQPELFKGPVKEAKANLTPVRSA